MSINAIGNLGNETAVHYLTPQPETPDSQLVLQINNILYHQFGRPVKTAILEVLSHQEIGKALDLFTQIRSREAKIEAFEAAICSDKGRPLTANLPNQFYAALPVDLQEEFRHQLWVANGCDDDGRGINFGEYVVDNGLANNPLAKAAIQAMRSS